MSERLNTLVRRYGRTLGALLYAIEERMHPVILLQQCLYIMSAPIYYYLFWKGENYVLVTVLMVMVSFFLSLVLWVFGEAFYTLFLEGFIADWYRHMKAVERKEKDES